LDNRSLIDDSEVKLTQIIDKVRFQLTESNKTAEIDAVQKRLKLMSIEIENLRGDLQSKQMDNMQKFEGFEGRL
jgi:TolA-binding protein